MRKLFSMWVPPLLTSDQKQQRVEDSGRCSELFKEGKKDFLHRYMIMDETWIHHYTHETKISSTESTAAGESRPKRPKNGILFINYLENSKTINSDYCMALLDRMSAEIRKKWPHMQNKEVLFHQDNAPWHKSMKTMVKLN